MKYIKFEDLEMEVQSFIVNESNMKNEEETLTHASVEEAIGGAVGAVAAILEDVYTPRAVMDAICCDYEQVKYTLSSEAHEALKDQMLANAVAYKTAYRVLSEAMASGIKYINFGREVLYTKIQDIMDQLARNLGGADFVSVHPEGDAYVHTYHIMAFNDNHLVVNSETLTQAEVKIMGLETITDALFQKGEDRNGQIDNDQSPSRERSEEPSPAHDTFRIQDTEKA